MIQITKQLLKKEFSEAEKSFEFCWNILVMLKHPRKRKKGYESDLLIFQEKLANTIFQLYSVREQIIKLEKHYISNKSKYNYSWFNAKMKTLANYKTGVDYVANIAKSFGDAFAYFFYQKDIELFTEHLSHQRIVNYNAGIGERGELEFIKNVKHIQGNFILFHGITNVLRYGDYSFIDLKTLRTIGIGELKTKLINPEKINLTLTLIKRNPNLKKGKIHNSKDEKDRRKRQLLNISNFLNKEIESDKNVNLFVQNYSSNVESLIFKSKLKEAAYEKVSDGLAYACIKLKKTSIFNRVYCSNFKTDSLHQATGTINSLVKKGSTINSIIMGQLLYNPDFTDKNTPGTVPIFWHPINHKALKKLYFGDCFVISLFNPAHLIETIEEMGFAIDSKYGREKLQFDSTPKKNSVQYFDLFISYIMNFLMSEDFVIQSIKETISEKYEGPTILQMKPQQKY